MNYKLSLFTTLSILGIAFLASLSFAQEKMDPENQQEMIAKYMELAKPGEEHELLESLTGDWEQEIKTWMQPGADPMNHKGKAINKMVLGGRFLQTNATGGEGQFLTENIIIYGYDKRHKNFTVVGFDTWGTYYVTAAGDYIPEEKKITMYGEDEDPTMKVTQKYFMNIYFINENKYITDVVFKDFRTKDEKEFKMVEIVHTRKK